MLDGCGVPSMILLKNKGRVMIVEVGVISRGEVGVLVFRCWGGNRHAFYEHLHFMIIMMDFTTIVYQFQLKKSSRSDLELI